MKFTSIFHLGIVVADLDKAVEIYTKELGYGPFELGDGAFFQDKVINGEIGPGLPMKTAIYREPRYEIELIQPTGPSIYMDFLQEKGPGVHHVILNTDGRYAVLSYYVIYVVGSYTLISPVFSVMSFAQMLGNVPLPWLTQKFGKIRVYVAANFLSAASLLILFFLSKNPVSGVIIALSAIIGFLSASGSISYSFTCDSVEYGDWKYGIRDDGLAFSIMSFGVKLSQALTGAIAAPLLIAMGYVANQAQAPATVNGINALVNIAPAVILIVAMIPILAKYRLDEKMMDKITTELEARRSGAAQ